MGVSPGSHQASSQSTASSLYSGLSDEAAKAKFERTSVSLRIKQREAMRVASKELLQLANQPGLDQRTRHTLQQISERLANSSDLVMVLELALQERQQLNAGVHSQFDSVTAALSQHWSTYQNWKREYQPAAGKALAARWTKLSLEQKRCQLFDYLSLVDQRPAWLLRSSPIDNEELVPKQCKPPIVRYLGEKNDLIRGAQRELKTAIEATRRLAVQEARSDAPTSEEAGDHARAAAARIAEVLDAPYAGGLRGVMLCVPDEALSEKLNATVRSLLHQFIDKTQELKAAHERLLRDLTTSLESGQEERLRNLKFEEQMAIDIRLANVTHLIQPVRVFANRSTRTGYFEDAKLLEVTRNGNDIKYRVELLIDGVVQWVDPRQIVTHQTDKLSQRMLTDIPATGPGRVVTEQTDFATGQVFAFSPAGWKPVLVVDESALGVVVRWQGPAEPIEFYFPRNELRIVE